MDLVGAQVPVTHHGHGTHKKPAGGGDLHRIGTELAKTQRLQFSQVTQLGRSAVARVRANLNAEVRERARIDELVE